MGCSSCSTEKDGKPGGCRSNGTCGTGGCNKLNVYNWLTDMTLPMGQAPYDVVEVRFKGSRKEFFRNKENIPLKTGDTVAVEAMPGHDVGVVSLAGELVRFQLKKKGMDDNSDQIKALYRKAKQSEVEKWFQVKDSEASTLSRARTIIQSLKLSMKLSDVEFQGDGKKATFYYTADDRVDFRELIRKLADEFHVRVEMRQIGMRQEAGRLGGLGSCGRELCCSTWLVDFKTVSTSAARYQNLALNPAKLAGQCGKLKCCLNYELDSYMDALKDFPKTNVVLESEKGRASHRKTDIFKRMMWFAYDQLERTERRERQESEGDNWIALSVDRVNEVIALNKQQLKPVDLKEFEEEEIDTTPDFENVVGQDRIDRMDKTGKRKKKKKKKSGQGGQQLQAAGQASSSVQQPSNQPRQAKPAQQNRPQQQGQPQNPNQQNRNQQNKNRQQGQQQRNPNQQNQQQDKPQQSQPAAGQPPKSPDQQKPQQQGQPQNPNQQNRNRPQRQQPPKNPETPNQ